MADEEPSEGLPTVDAGTRAKAPPKTLVAEVARPVATRLTRRDLIASGGMGIVCRVSDTGLDRDCAMKTIHAEFAEHPRSQASFIREARVTGRLEHPNIVPVHDIGVDSKGQLYFTMKLVSGRTLRDIYRALPPGPASRDELLNLCEAIVKVCDAIAFAHSRGVLHCDLKAANVMVGDFGQVYLMDWGVARGNDDSTNSSSPPTEGERVRPRGGPISGTPSHMSPEQALGAADQMDERSDVFLVGSLLYEILARRAPYRGATVMATIVIAAMHRYRPIDEVAPELKVPGALGRIVDRAMAEKPEDRYPSVAELRADLVRFIRGGGAFPRRRFAAGEHIVVEGEVGDVAYLIVDGRCEVYVGHGDAKRSIRVMESGEGFGEMAILTSATRTASVVCLEDTLVECITRDIFEEELDGYSPWMASIVRNLAARFREREERSEE